MHLLLDIEGTITDASGRDMGYPLQVALRRVQSEGTPTILCSGRDIDYMNEFRKRWGLGPMRGGIAENGSVVIPFPVGPSGAEVDPKACLMDRQGIIDRLEGDGVFENAEMDPAKRYILSIYVPGYMEGKPYTVEQLAALYDSVTASIREMECQIILTSASVEVVPVGVDKGTGISRYCELSDIGLDDVMFFCDSRNDVPGARAVKNGGGMVCAVGNATQELKEIADIVAKRDHWKGALELLYASGILDPDDE